MSSFALQIAMGIKMGLCIKWGLFLGIMCFMTKYHLQIRITQQTLLPSKTSNFIVCNYVHILGRT